jgi:hypothetical protein
LAVRLIESPNLFAFSRIALGDRSKWLARAFSVRVFDKAISSRADL